MGYTPRAAALPASHNLQQRGVALITLVATSKNVFDQTALTKSLSTLTGFVGAWIDSVTSLSGIYAAHISPNLSAAVLCGRFPTAAAAAAADPYTKCRPAGTVGDSECQWLENSCTLSGIRGSPDRDVVCPEQPRLFRSGEGSHERCGHEHRRRLGMRERWLVLCTTAPWQSRCGDRALKCSTFSVQYKGTGGCFSPTTLWPPLGATTRRDHLRLCACHAGDHESRQAGGLINIAVSYSAHPESTI